MPRGLLLDYNKPFRGQYRSCYYFEESFIWRKLYGELINAFRNSCAVECVRNLFQFGETS